MSNDLSPDMESFIQREISVGTFQSRDDVIEAGVSMLKKHRDLVDRLAESRRQLDAGEYFEYDQQGLRQLFDQLIARAEGRSPTS